MNQILFADDMVLMCKSIKILRKIFETKREVREEG